MRILFTFAGNYGHLAPLLPLARAAHTVGYQIAFVGRPWMQSRVEELGWTFFSAGSDRGLIPQKRPLIVSDINKERQDLAKSFGYRIARERMIDMQAICQSWQPDLIVAEETDFGAMIAAESLNIPYAKVVVIAAGGFILPELLSEPLNELRQSVGLPADPELEMLSKPLILSSIPPIYRDPNYQLPDHAIYFHRARIPENNVREEKLPLVYLTLGTVFPLESGDLFERIIIGLRDLPIKLQVTVGTEIDPARFGPQPANVRIDQFVPQHEILPQSKLIISHAGSGSVIGALEYGIPMILLPLGADQPLNAERCKALGVAHVVDPLTVTPQQIADLVQQSLADSAMQRKAQLLRDSFVDLPSPHVALAQLERLVAAH
jgi:UDP:flavonoid glycosyltransferase YjiC (YdhE family)